MGTRNPWANSKGKATESVPEYPVAQTSAYAAPGGGAPYITAFGWSPRLATSGSTTDVPSAQRLGTIPRMDMRPRPERPASDKYSRDHADDTARLSIEQVRATPWENERGSYKRFAPNPRSTPPVERRLTSSMTPASYSYVRPFDHLNRTHAGDPATGSRRTFSGVHFSMADHRRNYEILGMTPPVSHRNTYRIEPGPWDEGIVDLPAPVTSYAQAIRSVAAPSRRSYRAGG